MKTNNQTKPTGKVIMRRKKILTIVAGIMLISVALAVVPTAKAAIKFTVDGYVYVNDIITTPDKVVLSFSEQDVTVLVEQGYYIATGEEDIGQIGVFYITLTGEGTWQAQEELIIEHGQDYYIIDLHINTSDPPVNEAPNAPTLVSPSDGATDVGLNPTLSVSVSDPESEPMDVTFYDGSDTIIGSVFGISSGGTASIIWSGREYSTPYSWYAIAYDGQSYSPTSDTWDFTTEVYEYCGDGSCNNGEDCSTCPEDCGECDDGNGNGYSGSTGSTEPSNPVADAGGPYVGVVDEKITFDGSGSTGTDGTITGYRWDFNNDGTYDTEWSDSPTTEHSYSTAGDYTVKLLVKDSNNKLDTDTATVTIGQLNQNPTDPTVTGDMEGSVDTNYTYSAVSTDADDDNIKYEFVWGDGTNTTTDFADNNTAANATHQWSSADLYVVKVSAEDSQGGVSGTVNKLVFIDIDYIYLDEIEGYILDNEKDGTWDEFYNTVLDITTTMEKQEDGTYYIDTDGDGEWDYIYDPDTGALTEYTEEEEPEGEVTPTEDNTIWYVVGILAIIVVLSIVVLAAKSKEKPKKPKK